MSWWYSAPWWAHALVILGALSVVRTIWKLGAIAAGLRAAAEDDRD